jgi:hypothetical protein
MRRVLVPLVYSQNVHEWVVLRRPLRVRLPQLLPSKRGQYSHGHGVAVVCKALEKDNHQRFALHLRKIGMTVGKDL